jgi:DNA-binding NarL/FixJ family response regulator
LNRQGGVGGREYNQRLIYKVEWWSLDTTPATCTVEPLRVLVVDDFAPFREALRQLFDQFAAVAVVGEAGDGNSAIEMALHLVPEVIIMDVKMPRLGGVEATRRIKRVLPGIHVIGLSSLDDRVTREAMTAAGASALIAKEFSHTLPHLIAKIAGRLVAHDG